MTESLLLKKYAAADATFRGTAIVGNLSGKLVVLFIPGFGEFALPMSIGIQFLVSASLEVPLGHLGDKFGWRKAVNIGLLLKPLTTLCLMLAAISAIAGIPAIAWFFILSESIIDGIANALLSGNTQAGALEWYKKEGGTGNLFLQSQSHVFWLRFLIPIFAILICYGVHLAANSEIVTTFSLLTVLFALRFLVYDRLMRVMAEPELVSPGKRTHFFEGGKVLAAEVVQMSASVFMYNLFIMYFLGRYAVISSEHFGIDVAPQLFGFATMFVLVFMLQVLNRTLHPLLGRLKVASKETVLIVCKALLIGLVFFNVQHSNQLTPLALLGLLVIASLALAINSISIHKVHNSEFKGNSSAIISMAEMASGYLLGFSSLYLATSKELKTDLIFLAIGAILCSLSALTSIVKSRSRLNTA